MRALSLESISKGAFTHPVYACVYRNALRFFITYLGLLMSVEKKVITLKMQCNAENACGNRMWQLAFINNKNPYSLTRNDLSFR